jgi:hypothetical protein
VDDEFHFRVDGAEHVEIANHRKCDARLAARLLIAGVVFERI